MPEVFLPELPIWEIALRGTAVYFGITLVMRLIPKRHTGNLSPNDMISLVIVGSLAADAILGGSESIPDIFLMIAVVLGWDYLFNFAEYRFPWFRRLAQDSPTLLIHDGVVLERNLRHEQLTEEELAANLRRQGVDDMARVKQAVLEVDGHISVIEKD